MNLLARAAIRTALLATFGTVTIGVGVCDPDRWFEYRAHSDRVTPGAGNAVAANIAVQTVDPWPAHSSRKRSYLDGKRAHKAIKRYETNTSIPPSGLDTMRLPRPPANDAGGNGGK